MRKRLILAISALLAATVVRRYARRAANASEPSILGPEAVRDLYNRLAPVYDGAAAIYGPARTRRFRTRAVGALGLGPGDTVVDLACGTGANFAYLVEAVGPAGRVIGVDFTPGMLDRARQRAQAKGWGNIELVESDVRDYDFPSTVHGVISTFGLEMIPEYDAVIGRVSDALEPGGRISAGGLRRPGNWPEWLIRCGEFVSRPFGVNRAYEKVQPWRSVEARMTGVRYEEYLLGAVYLAVGEKPASVR